MTISQKKRFQILERDWFSCKFCWRKPPFVQLEVDHIIPKKEWGDDGTENLHTTCFDCNRGKWGKVKWESKKDLYKTKIYDNAVKAKKYFYSEWNKKLMWSICEKTKVLVSMYVNNYIVENDAYCAWLNFPPLYPGCETPLKDGVFEYKKYDSMFKLWWEYCERVLDMMYCEVCESINEIIKDVFDENYRNEKRKWEYWSKLNYYLTENLEWVQEDYVIKKFTLHPKLIWKKDR